MHSMDSEEPLIMIMHSVHRLCSKEVLGGDYYLDGLKQILSVSIPTNIGG